MAQTSCTKERHSLKKDGKSGVPATTPTARAGVSSTQRTNAVGCQGLPHCHHHTQGRQASRGMSSLLSSVGSPPEQTSGITERWQLGAREQEVSLISKQVAFTRPEEAQEL